MTSRAALTAAAALALSLAGCATQPPASDPDAVAEYQQTNDPLEPTNRVLYAVNDGLDSVLLRPLAVGYTYAVPVFVRARVHDALDNLNNPVLLANDILQTNPRRAGDTLMRFVINSTVGGAGLFDVATDWGYPEHDSDFGVTLAVWGLPEGPFLYLPVLGPSNPRDATGFGVDIAMDPLTWIGKGTVVTDLGYVHYGLTAVDARAGLLGQLDTIKQQALDPYATFRSLYRQHRASLIKAAKTDEPATPVWFPPPATH
jgi:phospholipid-binding lipoprotein MlaA